MKTPYMDMDKIAVVRIEFHEMSDLILTKEEYEEMGAWKGFLNFILLSTMNLNMKSCFVDMGL